MTDNTSIQHEVLDDQKCLISFCLLAVGAGKTSGESDI